MESLTPTIVQRIWHSYGEPPVCVHLPSGAVVGCPADEAVGGLHIKDFTWLPHALLNRDLAVGDAIVDGSIVIEGDLLAVLEAVHSTPPEYNRLHDLLRRLTAAVARPISNAAARSNASHHYEAESDFYRLWLDPSMTYTCAYFEQEHASLADAQRAKLDYVCRKLRLCAGERVVDAGSGWGSLAVHMAVHYGVEVDCYNVSQAQNEIAAEMAASVGVANRIRFISDDYRTIDGTYDAFVSVGMLEHVGQPHYAELGTIIRRAIGNTGRGLVHTIGRSFPMPTNGWISRRIFPGGYAPSLREALGVFEPNGLAVLDVENLRLHYARTLAIWLANLTRERETIEEQYGTDFYRSWELYLASACAGFRSGWLQLFQMVFAPTLSNDVPLVRADPYSDNDSGPERTLRLVGDGG